MSVRSIISYLSCFLKKKTIAGDSHLVTSEGERISVSDFALLLNAQVPVLDTHYGRPVQTLAHLSALANPSDKERRYVEDQKSDYFFDQQAASGDVPKNGGFWVRSAGPLSTIPGPIGPAGPPSNVDLTNLVTTNTDQAVTGAKTFNSFVKVNEEAQIEHQLTLGGTGPGDLSFKRGFNEGGASIRILPNTFQFIIANTSGGESDDAHIRFRSDNSFIFENRFGTDRRAILNTAGNFIIGSTNVDTGHKLQVQGNVSISGSHTILANDTSVYQIQAVDITPTLSTLLDETALVGLRVAPTFNTNGNELVETYAIHSVGNLLVSGNIFANNLSNLVRTNDDQTITGSKVFDRGSSFQGVNIGLGGGNNTFNTRVGMAALGQNGNGHSNVAVGRISMFSNISGSGNAALGFASMWSNTSGSWNVSIGHDAARNQTTGQNNVFIGVESGLWNTGGSNNTAVGRFSLASNGNGQLNCAFGSGALAFSVGASHNCAFGNSSSNSDTSGGENASFGSGALQYNNGGGRNVAIGRAAGRIISTGADATGMSESIFIGFNAKPAANTQVNQIVIGNNSTGLGSNTTVLGNTNTTLSRIFGRLLLGDNTDTGEALQVTGKTRTGTLNLSSVLTFADNAAAIAGGLIVGDVYVTSTGVVMRRF